MAGTNNYKLILEAQLDPKTVEAQIKALSGKNVLMIKAQFNQSDMKKFEAELEKIKEKASSVGKITLLGNKTGGINKAIVEYRDQIGNVVKETLKINNAVKITQSYTENLAKDELGIVKLKEQQAKLSAKQADEMGRAALNAEKFLAKSASMDSKNPQVMSAIGTAQQIKIAVSEGDIAKVRTLNEQFQIQKAALSAGKTALDSWTSGIKNAIKQTIEYSISIGLVYGALNQIRQGLQFVKDLNKEMTNIQVLQVTGAQTPEEIGNLALQYNDLAKEMGATTIEVAQGSVEWLRQGKSIAETQELLRATLMLAKLGNLETADATNYLTSTLNSYSLGAKDAVSVVDKLIAVDNVAATSAGELATALQYSASASQQAGVSLDELISYIGTVSSVTRQSAETIGQSFKTMFARMQDIKAGKIDEDGIGLNNVESALARVDIKLRDSKNEFRDMSDVLQDVAKKWDSLNEIEQANLSKSIAGIRQVNIFNVLMKNMNQALELQAVAANSAGTSMDRYKIYLENTEAAQNRFIASWEKLAMGSASANMISDFYDGAAAVLDLIDALGGIPTILKIATVALVIFNAELIKTKILAGVDMVQGLVLGLRALIPTLATATTATEGFSVAIGAANLAALPFIATLAAIAAGIYLVTKAYGEYQELQSKIQETKKTASGTDGAKTYDDYVKSVNKAAIANGYLVDSTGKLYREVQTSRGIIHYYGDEISLLTEEQWKAKQASEELGGSIGRAKDDIYVPTAQAVSDLTYEYKGFSDTLKALTDGLDTVNGLVEKSMKGELSFSDINNIPPEYLDALTTEGDKLTLNIDLIKKKQLADAEMSLQAIEQARARGDATSQEVAVVQLYYNQLAQASQHSFGQFSQTAWQYDALLWQISNDAVKAGYTFVDMEGNALNSAQSIHDYLASSDVAFNNFVQQAAIATGRSAQEVMNIINGMVAQTYNNTVSMINALGGMVGGLSPDERDERRQIPTTGGGATPLFPVGGGGYSGGGGGGGSSNDKEQQRLERLKKIEQDIADARSKATDDLKYQLKLYKDIIDARKKILDTMADERKYQQDVADKNKEILNVQVELNALQFDNSEEANARKLQLQDELSRLQQELENINYDETVKDQKAALDADYESFQAQIETAIRAVEDISATTVSSFTNQLATILQGLSQPIPSFHSGAEQGVVGNKSVSMKSNEIFAKLMEGEVVSNPAQMDNFLNKTIPQMAQSISNNTSGDYDVNVEINVAGSLDKTVLPAIKDAVEKAIIQANENMKNRGYIRRTDAYSI